MPTVFIGALSYGVSDKTLPLNIGGGGFITVGGIAIVGIVSGFLKAKVAKMLYRFCVGLLILAGIATSTTLVWLMIQHLGGS